MINIQGLSPDLAAAMMTPKVPDMSPLQQFVQDYHRQQQQALQNQMAQRRMGMDEERLGFERQNFEETQRRRNEIGRLLEPGNPTFNGVPAPLVDIARVTRDPAPIVQHFATQGRGTDDIKEFEYAVRGGFKGTFSEWMQNKRASAGQYGLNPLWGTNERGDPVAFQASNQGGVKPIDLPPGVKWQHGVEKVDMGDRWGLLDKKSGQIIGYLPKNIAGAKVEEAVGEDRGKIITTAPKLIATVESLEQQHRLVRDEIRRALQLTEQTAAAGIPSIITSKIPGTTGYQLAQLIKTIKANVGFDKLNQMRAESPTGGALGQVAVQELEYLQAVLGSLEQAQDPAVIQDNLFRLNEYLSDYGERRRRMLEADLKRAGVSPDLLNRQQGLNRLDYGMADRKGARPAADQREFVGMQVDSRPGVPVAPERAPAQPAASPVPMPRERRPAVAVPEDAINDLMRNPSPRMKRFFEDHFKLPEGAADDYLKGRR